MCQVAEEVGVRCYWPTQPWISYGLGMSLPCPEGEQARRMGASCHPLCDTLATPCRLGSREALSLRFLSLSGSPTPFLEAGM